MKKKSHFPFVEEDRKKKRDETRKGVKKKQRNIEKQNKATPYSQVSSEK